MSAFWYPNTFAANCANNAQPPWYYDMPTIQSQMYVTSADSANYQWIYPCTTAVSSVITQLTFTVNPLYTGVYYGNYVVEQTEEQKRIWAEEEKKRVAAEVKAEELLLMCLSEKQRDQYCKHGYLEVNTDKAKYRIKKGWSKNIEKLNAEGIPDLVYCIGSEILIPTADNMLAQKLMLECNESEFLRIANKWPTSGGIYVP